MKHFEMPKPPYLGAAYYPEDWDDDQIDVDVAKMVELGLKVVRIGEFAWHRMEPKPGEHLLDVCSAPGSKACHMAEIIYFSDIAVFKNNMP